MATSANSVTISKHEDLVHAVTCKVCLDIPLTGHLHQCSNGHLICRSCYEQLTERPRMCPECRGGYIVDGASGEPQRNLLADMVVDKIKIPCKYNDHGCQSRLPRAELIGHHNSCQYANPRCKYHLAGCSERGPMEWIRQHEASCQHRSEPCRYAQNGCMVQLKTREAHKHGLTCAYQTLKCFNCSNCLPAIKLADHHKRQHRHIKHESGLTYNIQGFNGSSDTVHGCFLTHGGQQFYASLQSEGHQIFNVQVTLVFSVDGAGEFSASLAIRKPSDGSTKMAFIGPVNPPEMLGQRRFPDMSRLTFTKRLVQQLGQDGKVNVSFKIGTMRQHDPVSDAGHNSVEVDRLTAELTQLREELIDKDEVITALTNI